MTEDQGQPQTPWESADQQRDVVVPMDPSSSGDDADPAAAETIAPLPADAADLEVPAAVPEVPMTFKADDFDDTDHEPFDRPDTYKLGIVGGKGVGKSYLFQAMVYRTFAGLQSGALTYYLEHSGSHLFIGSGSTGNVHTVDTAVARSLNRVRFIDKYRSWQRLPFTSRQGQQWYRLRLLFQTGFLGRDQSSIDVEFFDASGEGLMALQAMDKNERELWRRAYLDAHVMVFCLPLWAAFPDSSLTDTDWDERAYVLADFEQVVQNYRDMRSREHETRPVTTVLALTMADDRRSALQTLRARWITPYMDSPHTYLKQLRTGRGVARYLANARRVSEALHEEFASSRDPRVVDMPNLDFGRGRPWIVPLSAIEGARLDDLETRYPNPDDPARLRASRNSAPTPVHVELPLLVALCERDNALM